MTDDQILEIAEKHFKPGAKDEVKARFVVAVREVLETECADLKQQLHAYREYHDARDAYETCPGNVREAWLKMQNANIQLQILRTKER